MLARLSAFVIWAVVAASLVFWGMRLLVRAPAAPGYVVPVGDASAVRGDLSRLLGSAPLAAATPAAAAVDANARFRLFGIMAPKGAVAPVEGHGVALIAIDGKMPRAFPVGSRIDGDLVLQSVSLRTASIGPGQGAAVVTLELPPLAAAATGKLPAGGGATPPMPVPQIAPPAMPPQAQVPQPMTPQVMPPQPMPQPQGQTQSPGSPARPDVNAQAQ